MKLTASSHSPAPHGNVLIMTLVFFGIVALTTAGYLSLARSRTLIRARSLAWNSAIPVAEAGIEEAFTHIKHDSAASTANGWMPGTNGGQPVLTKSRTFPDGSYFAVKLYGATNIYSTGFVPAPLNPGQYISRIVKITGFYPPLINVAFAAVYSIQMDGDGLASNSFDSSKTNLSTDGHYDPSKTSTNGNVASVNGPVDFGNHSIAGNLYLGPDVVNSSVSSSQVSGQIYNDFNVSFPDAELPATLWSAAPIPTMVAGSMVQNFTSSGDYFTADSNDNILVQPGVTVRLRVDATSFSPNDVHILETNGVSGTLIIYQVSGSCNLRGSNSPDVDSGRARNFWYYGLPGVTSITYGGNSSFTGVIYAPGADLKLNGGGANIGLIGSSITKTIAMNGHYDFHFDEDLLTSGPSRGFVLDSWREL
jgi:hypothetical protein